MEKVLSGIEFKKENLEKGAGYSLITRPGMYALQVASTVTEKNLVQNASNGNSSYIVGFKAIAEDKFAQVQEVFGESDVVAIESTQGLFLTGNLWKQNASRLPLKNEYVDCVIDYVPTREDKDVAVLRITAMSLRPMSEAKKINVSEFFSGHSTSASEGTIVKEKALQEA